MGEGRICPIHPPGGTVRTNVRGQPYLFYIDIFARPPSLLCELPLLPLLLYNIYNTSPPPKKGVTSSPPFFSSLPLSPCQTSVLRSKIEVRQTGLTLRVNATQQSKYIYIYFECFRLFHFNCKWNEIYFIYIYV